ncbi:hypothetical protein THOM_2739 [Trachipleistophora hominis]|uniref:Uncharacterized protein n=1 Tax=Trachipleistophora hominis TaxID=72359 RepID=L7JTK0_TRAHO|nr:hypothetical protein THOM_2739 [Trachipleistophora hominis]
MSLSNVKFVDDNATQIFYSYKKVVMFVACKLRLLVLKNLLALNYSKICMNTEYLHM